MTNRSITYRDDIDGLRAIAVLLVLFFHAFPKRISGGYIGVDAFFVISGYLITQLLLQDLQLKSFSFVKFYARRIRRIFPALIVVLATCLLVAWFVLTPGEFSSFGLNLLGGAAFSSNFVSLYETGYFDLASDQKPLLHLWSLGVEEQFYIVWPVALLLTSRVRIRIVGLACGILIASFLLNIVEAGSSADFYSPLTRTWELMLGGVLAARTTESGKSWLLGLRRSLPRALPGAFVERALLVFSDRELRSWSGLALIGLAVIVLSKYSRFPGWWALLPTLGTALIVSAEGARFNRTVLSNPIVVFVGLISYPLYLWHWPLLSYVHLIQPDPQPILKIAAVISAFVLACVTYYLIENPIRRGRIGLVKVASLCGGMAILGCLGVWVFLEQGVPQRIPPAIRDVASLQITADFEKSVWRLHTCLLETNDTLAQFTSDCLESQRPLLFLWGDSFAAALYPGLRRLQQSANFGLAQFTSAGCPPLLAFQVAGRPNCEDTNAHVLSVIAQTKPDILLLHSAWVYDVSALAALIRALRDLRLKRIVIMGPGPEWEGGEPKAAYDYYMHSPLHQTLPARSDFRIVGRENDNQLRKRVLLASAEYISAWEAFCNGQQCLTRVGNRAEDLVAYDAAHLTVPAATFLAKAIAPCLFPDLIADSVDAPSKPGAPSRICPAQGSSEVQPK